MEKKQAMTDVEILEKYKSLKSDCVVLIGTKGICVDTVNDDLLIVTENETVRICYLDTADDPWDIARFYVGEITDVQPLPRLIWINGEVTPADIYNARR